MVGTLRQEVKQRSSSSGWHEDGHGSGNAAVRRGNSTLSGRRHQALVARPFEHADQLAAAQARQQQLEVAMRDQAAAEAPEPAAQAS